MNQLIRDYDWRQEYKDLEQYSKYLINPRYPHHTNLYYTGYNNLGCQIYLKNKENHGHWPLSVIKCNLNR